MPLSNKDKDFRLQKVNYLDFQHIEMDRVLTNLFGRLRFDGLTPRVERLRTLEISAFVEQILSDPERFSGFDRFADATHRWVETHLLDLVNRGKPNQAIAAPRPLHGHTYRFRNVKHARDYGAAQHIYELLDAARNAAGRNAIEKLKRFFFEGLDPVTGQPVAISDLDVETQALLSFAWQVKDTADERYPRESFPPLCIGGADLMAEDIQRLLFYRPFVPRSVLVDYLKILISFHLAVYHLRIIRLLPTLVRRAALEPTCALHCCPLDRKANTGTFGACPQRFGLFLDVAGRPDTDTARLAARSADAHLRRLPPFIHSYFALRKLDEFAADMIKRRKFHPADGKTASVRELLALLGNGFRTERETYFEHRMYNLVNDCADDADETLAAIRNAQELGLGAFETYLEILVTLRGENHRSQLTSWLDSLMLKNRPGAFITQPRTRNARRRFVLDSRLLEVLLQVIVLRPGGVEGYHTGAPRVDEILLGLRERYGLHIDQLPDGDGFGEATIHDRRALRTNREAFLDRLRELGYFRDLSDAYIAQTVTPRYRIGASAAGTGEPQPSGSHPITAAPGDAA